MNKEIGILALMLLVFSIVAFLWFGREQHEPTQSAHLPTSPRGIEHSRLGT